jgi:uncharacterized protein YxeA|tara:strand:- start:348 stop:500 length:153 start_codon:yes stop_codon:yes gene_type:complete
MYFLLKVLAVLLIIVSMNFIFYNIGLLDDIEVFLKSKFDQDEEDEDENRN